MNNRLSVDDISRIVGLISGTTDPDIKKILKEYLAWNLMPTPVMVDPKRPGSMRYVDDERH